MDEFQPASKPSGIPRPSKLPLSSKLPVPRSTAALRPSPSREALSQLRPSASREALSQSTSSSLRNPKLRSTPSRDQLGSSGTAAAALRSQATATSSLSSPQPPRTRLASSPASIASTRNPRPTSLTVPNKLVRPAAPTPSKQRPSEQWISGPLLESDTGDEGLAFEEVGASSPLASDFISQDDTFNTIRASASKPRPSLAERTMETLAQIPSSPAVKGGRPSAFYDPGSARKRANSRPGSSGSRPGSSHRSDSSYRPASRPGSRPSSSSGPDERVPNFRASTNTYTNTLSTIDGTPSRGRQTIKALKAPSSRTSIGGTVRASKIQPPNLPPISRSRTPSPEKRSEDGSMARFGNSKTMAVRGLKPRQSLSGLFRKPSLSTISQAAAPIEAPRKVSSASQRSSNTSLEGTAPSSASAVSTNTAITADSGEFSTSRKSSAALRDQIAKAKAAKRAASNDTSKTLASAPLQSPLIPTDTTFDFGLSPDPFSQHRDDNSKSKVLQGRVESARTSGRLNIAAMGLREIPVEVMKMYELESMSGPSGSWAESVDLTRFVAADNELEMIAESIFPDKDPQDFDEEEASQGNIFGGLETLDLHGNMLIALPMGLRRLSLLTSLNLSQNQLANNCVEIISQITSLRDLKVGGNLLYGPLDPSFSNLENLEILDLHGNNISSLPSNMGNLSKLRILNVSENSIELLPFEILAALPLTELLARKNQLSGTLITGSTDSLPNLQSLDVSANQLTHIAEPGMVVKMPSLHQLTVSMNRLQKLPDIGTWTSLLTISADENSINAIPDGFTNLENLRSVDFSSNDIRVVPAEIGRMENLAMLRLSGNPLREKKFSSIDTDELKAILAGRLEPVPVHIPETITEEASMLSTGSGHMGGSAFRASNDDNDDSRSDDDFATPPTSAPGSPTRSRSGTASGQTWPLKAGGVLDRSNTESSSLHPVICSKLASSKTVREIQLHHNLFATFPDSLSFFAETLTSLSLAHNKLVGESYLSGDRLELPALKELNLASNHITSLVPLTTHLAAPGLEKLDVSLNRIASLPAGTLLKEAFPALTVLLIANNHLADLDPESIRGLCVVDANNNDIAHLNPRIGLLGGAGGLQRLEVNGNRFRVPRWNVLERGSEATLRWLRGRVPVAEMAAWKGDGEEMDRDDMSMADLD